MSTYTQIIYQIVFGTKNREKTLDPKNREELFKYIHGLLKNKNCHCYQIGGVSDHLHIVTHIHPSVSLANIVKDIKLSTSELIKTQKLFPNFRGWQEGYGAFTYSMKEKDRLVEYVKNQESHHHKTSFMDEYRMFLNEHKIDFDEKYLL
ncbi:MAG: IS200/IS605 family transposase [Bacteroidia bacterium]|nr:IS200/IS605 family transposase [Bacteroidia bacterium]